MLRCYQRQPQVVVAAEACSAPTVAWRQVSHIVTCDLRPYRYVLREKLVLERIQWDTLIIDEAHRLKGRTSTIRGALMQLGIDWKLLLTGALGGRGGWGGLWYRLRGRLRRG